MSKGNILVFGELLNDLYIDPSGKQLDRRPGGAPANLSSHLRDHLRGPGSVFLVSSIGPPGEPEGDELQRLLEERGVDCRFLERHPSRTTGKVLVHHHQEDSPYTVLPGAAYEEITGSPELLAASKQCSVLCFGSLVQRSPTSRQALYQLLDSSDALHVCDINLRRECFTRETIEESLRRTHVLKLNDKEVGDVSALLACGRQEPRDFYQTISGIYGIRTMLVTQGAQGVTAFSAGGIEIHVPGFSVREIDATGAGDSFTAMFVAKFLGDPRYEKVTCLGPKLHTVEEDHLRECCIWANALGALVASRMGGMTGVGEQEVVQLVSERTALPQVHSREENRWPSISSRTSSNPPSDDIPPSNLPSTLRPRIP